jgi:hypothetical protein
MHVAQPFEQRIVVPSACDNASRWKLTEILQMNLNPASTFALYRPAS